MKVVLKTTLDRIQRDLTNKLIAIAEGIDMQVRSPHGQNIWRDCTHHAALVGLTSDGFEVRIKPKTIMIGDSEVPEPLRVAPAIGSTYWRLNLSDRRFEIENWQAVSCEVRWLKTGLLQATEQGAQQMLAALVKQLGGVL